MSIKERRNWDSRIINYTLINTTHITLTLLHYVHVNFIQMFTETIIHIFLKIVQEFDTNLESKLFNSPTPSPNNC